MHHAFAATQTHKHTHRVRACAFAAAHTPTRAHAKHSNTSDTGLDPTRGITLPYPIGQSSPINLNFHGSATIGAFSSIGCSVGGPGGSADRNDNRTSSVGAPPPVNAEGRQKKRGECKERFADNVRAGRTVQVYMCNCYCS